MGRLESSGALYTAQSIHVIAIRICVTNLVASHHTTAAHHPWTTTPIIHCTTTHTFPSTIAPITQLSPITNQPCQPIVLPHLHLIHSPTYKQHTSLHVAKSCFAPADILSVSPVFCFPVFTWTAYTTLTICCLPSWPCLPCDILSVCRLPRPLHCPCCWFCLAFITPVTAFDHCLSDLLLSVLKLQLDLTSLPLHYNMIARIYLLGFLKRSCSFTHDLLVTWR